MSKAEFDLVIGGRVVTPERILDRGYVGVRGARIAAVGETLGPLPPARRTVSAGHAYVLPGVVDTHVHTRSEPAEGITRCTEGAVAGGVTTIVDMPYDMPAAVPDLETFRKKIADVTAEAVGDVALYGTIRKDGGLDEIERIAGAGACAFKVATYEADPVRFPRIPDGELLAAFHRIAASGVPVAVHCENQDIADRGVARARAAGQTGPLAHCRSRPPVSETEAVGRVLELAYGTSVHLHIVHASVPRSFDLIHRSRAEGVHVTAETCIQYLVLDETAMERLGPFAKINPPLRGPRDVEGLWRELAAGRIDQVTSDHAPWARARKSDPDIFANASGAPGVETLLPLLYHFGVGAGRISILDLVSLLAERPARNFGLFPRKGVLLPGADADLTVFDPDVIWTVRGQELHSPVGWTPFEGMELRGRAVRTFVRGRPAYEDGVVVARPGDGEFIPPVRGTRAGGEIEEGRSRVS
ncbi:MAG TPA: dihydroorotase family protein [bacterium]|nr:dihydroorotase family protein [bacterium]